MHSYKILTTFMLSVSLIFCEIGIGIEEETNLLKIVPCVKKLCAKYFKSERALKGSLIIVNINPDASEFQKNLLMALNEDKKHESGVMVKDARKKHWNASHVTEKAKNYFMLVSNSTELSAPIKQLRGLPTWNPLASVVILFTTEIEPDTLEVEVRNVLEELFEKDVLNVNVMAPRYNSSILDTYTWFPYENSQCARKVGKVRLIDECESVKDESDSVKYLFGEQSFYSELFPKIPHEFHNCPLEIGAIISEPYVVGSKDSSIVDNGLEVLMIEAMGRMLKLKPKYTIFERQKATDLITANNETGIYGQLLQK